MIAKIKRNSSIEGTVLYNLKDNAQLIDTHNLPGDNINDYIKLMKLRVEKFKGRAENKIAHSIISPSIEDGKILSIEEWREIGFRYLSRMGLENHQSICFIHEDKKHKHLHIVTNRINNEGNIYRPNANEIVLSQRAGREIAKELGLKNLKDQSRNQNSEEGLFSEIRKDLFKTIEILYKDYKDEKIFNVEKFFKLLELSGYNVKTYRKNKTEVIYGYAIEKSGNYFKSTALGKEFTISSLKERFSKNTLDTKEKIKKDLVKLIESQKNNDKDFDIELLFFNLRTLGYKVKVHYKKDFKGIVNGEIHGYSIGLESNFYKSSDIGKEFTLKNLIRQQKEQTSSKNLFELEKLSTQLKDLTSGYSYSSKEEFINHLEKEGFKIYMRFKNGEPTGYKIRVGRRSYDDITINNGAFCFDKLIDKGIISEDQHYKYPERRIKSSLIDAIDEVMKKRIESNIKSTIEFFEKSGEFFSVKKFFHKLNDFGYEIRPFYKKETNELSGYSIGIGSVYYNSSNIGKEFSLNAIRKLLNEKNTIKKVSLNSKRKPLSKNKIKGLEDFTKTQTISEPIYKTFETPMPDSEESNNSRGLRNKHF
ncbi:MAG: relaxase/mobilization nuclease domain-containing protein [Chryseotalea sp.]